MPNVGRTVLGFFFSLLLLGTALGQTTPQTETPIEQPVNAPQAKQSSNQPSAPIVTATANTERVRYISIGEVNATRLQVFSGDGTPVFDSDFRLGNLIDWARRDQQGTSLPDGSYLFLVTVKDFNGHLTQKYGAVLLEEEQLSIQQSSRDEMSSGQAAALESNKLSETLLPIDRIAAAGSKSVASSNDGGTALDNGAQAKKNDKVKAKASTTTGDNLSGIGTQNTIAKWTDNAGTLGDSTITEVGGQVGIGTSNPQGQLHIFGSASQDVFAGMGPDLINGPGLNFGYAGSSFGRGAGFFNVRPDASATAPNPSLRFATSNVQRMIITNTGNVGIGTLAPQTTLEVVNPATQIRFGSTSTDNGGYLVSTTAAQGILSGGAKWNGSAWIAKSTSASLVDNESGTIRFFLNSGLTTGSSFTPTEMMRITSTGSVGIGTTTPQTRLDVNGVINIQDGNTKSFFGGVSTEVGAQLINFGMNDNRFGGVDTSAQGGFLRLDTRAGRNLFQFFGRSSGGTGIAELMDISSSGKVGIGTTAPAAQLHVVDSFAQVSFGNFNGCEAHVMGMAFGTTQPSCTNYSVAGDGAETFINAPTPAHGAPGIGFRFGNTEVITIRRTETVGGVDGELLIQPNSFLVLGGDLNNDGESILCYHTPPDTNEHYIVGCGSSIRLKRNISSFNAGLSLIQRLRPVSFDWKSSGKRDVGLIAEDVDAVEPLLTTHDNKGAAAGVKYEKLPVVLINAIKEQQAEIKRLTAQVARLQTRLQQVNRKVEGQARNRARRRRSQ